MQSAIALFRGDAIMALITIPAHDNTNSIVVNGYPGTREVAVSDPICRCRKTNSAAAVAPKKMKSTVTSKLRISPYVPEQAMIIAAKP